MSTKTQLNDDESIIKQCAECLADLGQSDEPLVEALQHYIAEHPDSETLDRVLDGVRVSVKCVGCKSRFVTPLSSVVREGTVSLSARQYCPSCVRTDPLKELVHRDMTVRRVVEQEAAVCHETVELGWADVTGGIQSTKFRCPECDRSTGVGLPRGNCEHCGVELSLHIRSHL